MQYTSLRGRDVPVIGLGTWTLSGQLCTELLKFAADSGYRHIDTAQIYGNENEIGTALKASGIARREFFLVTKIPPSNFGYERALRSTEESLKRLRTDYVDLLLLHWPSSDIPLEETLGAVCELKSKGMVIEAGLSNFPPNLVEHAMDSTDIFCNRVEYHPYLSSSKEKEHSKINNYLFTAYCPLAKGRVNNDPVLMEIAKKYRKTPAQITLRWIVQRGFAAIPRSSRTEHILDNIDIFDFSLDQSDTDEIEKLNRGMHLDPVSHMSEC